MIDRWSWCPQMRLATKNKKVLQKFRKLGISQELFNLAINFLYVRVILSIILLILFFREWYINGLIVMSVDGGRELFIFL
jgi:hypothetical protein